MCIAGGRIETLGQARTGGVMGSQRPQGGRQTIPAHEHLYFEGDARDRVYVVESGWVKLYRTLVDGQRQVVGFANAGSVLGLESDAEHLNGCEAITQVTVRSFAAGAISDLCRTDPELATQIMRQIGRQLGAAQAQLATVGAQSAEQKLATFLLSIADLCGGDADSDFDLPMRRGDMAEFLGLRLETVSRKMTEFQRRGWIRMSSLYHCRLVRRDVLEELAEGGEAADAGYLRAS
jgi:CRP/FNR family transcriptional regulator, anaerobic regulatory protein